MFSALFSVNAKVTLLRHGTEAFPTVVLFGWAGGKLQHVAKYASLWHDESRVIVLAAPLGIFRGPSDAQIQAVIDEELLPQLGESKNVIFHIFSNGGLVYASRMFSILGCRLDRVVFDSSPSLDFSLRTPSHVVSEAINLPKLKSVIWWATFLSLSFLCSLFGHPNLGQYFGIDRLQQLEKKKLLFLYSSADIITDASMLKDFMVQFPHAQHHDFVDAAHVQLFPKYRKKYSELILNFRSEK